MSVLSVNDLHVSFDTRHGKVTALSGVSLEVGEGETLGIVGESGCGKSVTALAIMGLLPVPHGRLESGSIKLNDKELIAGRDDGGRMVRGSDIGMIFQEPMTSLNPVMTIGAQLTEVTKTHLGLSTEEATQHAAQWLDKMGIPNPRERLNSYPHEFSGGMRQRVMIAMALSCRPSVLIADEPTTALDVTVQAEIFELLRQMQAESKIAMILITHDVGAIAEMTDRVAVMYAGKVVECGASDDVLDRPAHPYTRSLINCIPTIASSDASSLPERLMEIPGVVPPLHLIGEGCAFAQRCQHTHAACSRVPKLTELGAPAPADAVPHAAACHLLAEADGERPYQTVGA